MNRNQRKTARERSHTEMMKAFYAYLETVQPRPLDDGHRYAEILAAFKAGWKAA